ncbi:MAG: hypothetical protein NTV24_03610 [Candidatus Woesebacteria bacterium]|nr:hypothetical protein [Candidatus Woesebacteria bacterium]
MLQTTTITQKWQMTLPKKIRQVLGIQKPGQILLEVTDQKCLKISQKGSILELAASLPPKNKNNQILDIANVRDYIEKNYQR